MQKYYSSPCQLWEAVLFHLFPPLEICASLLLLTALNSLFSTSFLLLTHFPNLFLNISFEHLQLQTPFLVFGDFIPTTCLTVKFCIPRSQWQISHQVQQGFHPVCFHLLIYWLISWLFLKILFKITTLIFETFPQCLSFLLCNIITFFLIMKPWQLIQ